MPIRGGNLTAWSLAALVLGLALGIGLHGSNAEWVDRLGSALAAIGGVWIGVLQFTVVPLVLSQTMTAVLRTGRLGSLGLKAMALFTGVLIAGGLFTLLVGPLVLSFYRPDPATVATLRSSVTIPSWLGPSLEPHPVTDWFRGYLPDSFAEVFQGANLLPLLLVTVLLAVAVRRFAGARLEPIRRRAQAFADFAFRIVSVILLLTPLGVLALAFGVARGAGGAAAGVLTFFVVGVSGMLGLFTVLLYPVTRILAGIPIRHFAWGVQPAQVTAASTRSSLASLPSLIEGARDRLGLPSAATGFVLPLAVSTFKPSIAVSHPFMLLFIGHVFGVSFSPGDLVTFLVMMILISYTVLGIPGGNPGVSTLPAFLAVGAPVEGVLILDSVDAIPDIFKTVLNVTADMSCACILTGKPATVHNLHAPEASNSSDIQGPDA